jgi:hypothetical protein
MCPACFLQPPALVCAAHLQQIARHDLGLFVPVKLSPGLADMIPGPCPSEYYSQGVTDPVGG